MTDDPIFDAVVIHGTRDLSAVVVWLTFDRTEWCVIGGHAVNAYASPTLYDARLDIATDGEPGLALRDLAEDGFAVRLDSRAQVAQLTRAGDGHRLQVTIRYGEQFRAMPQAATRRTILGQVLPVAALPDVTAALLWQRAAKAQMREATEAEMHLFRLAEAHPETLNDLLPADLRARAIRDRDRQHALACAGGDGWG